MFKLLACLLLSLASLQASTIANVFCGTPGAPLASSASSCYVPGIGGYSQASVSTSILLPSTSGERAFVSASSSVAALQTGVRGISTTATAQSSADVGILFSTNGPVRTGLLELTLDQTDWAAPVNGQVSETLNVASYTISPTAPVTRTVWIPIQLGTQFGFEYQQSITAISSSLSGLTTGQLAMQIGLLAFESDGKTSAQLFDPPGLLNQPLFTPEPASAGLFMFACLIGGVMLIKRRR